MSKKSVTKIETTKNIYQPLNRKNRKVAVYAHVSSDEDHQLNSVEAQKEHYTALNNRV